MDAEKQKPSLILSLITALGMGGGSGAALSYYVQDANARAIEKLELRADRIEQMIFQELKEINTRLSKIEGRLTKN